MRLYDCAILGASIGFQFTHPGRGATVEPNNDVIMRAVSIHAPREGCDSSIPATTFATLRFNSRTPGGVRRVITRTRFDEQTFQFTHPGRGATYLCGVACTTLRFQFTHPGRGATENNPLYYNELRVSIHAPREGCDISVREGYPCSIVSIHAPREGCD